MTGDTPATNGEKLTPGSSNLCKMSFGGRFRDAACRLRVWTEGRLGFPQVLVLSLVFVAVSVCLLRGGVVHPEVLKYLPHHLSERSLLQKIYDPKVLDMGFYQNRELSYLVDHVDCQFIAASVKAGRPHFLSLSFYFLIVTTGILFWWFCVHDLLLDRAASTLLLLIFYTSASVFMSGVYFRSSKPAIALMLMLMTFLIFRTVRSPAESRGPHRLLASLAYFGVSLAATGFDRQGFFMVAGAEVFLFLWTVLFRCRRGVSLLGAGLLALGVSLLSNYVITPRIIHALNGYWPDFTYQKLPLKTLMLYPGDCLWQGALLFADTIRFTFGNSWIVCVAIAVLLAFWSRHDVVPQSVGAQARPHPLNRMAILLVVMAGLVIAMNMLMYIRHSAVIWPDVRRGIYALPVVILLMIAVAFLIRWLYRRLVPGALVQLVLALLLVGNLASIPLNMACFRNGHMRSYWEATPPLLEGLRHLKDPAFFPEPIVYRNPIYQHFKKTVQ